MVLKNILVENKKAIGPVVATALLLVVAVVAIVGFSTWFGTYSSSTFVDVEQRGSQTTGGVSVDFLSNSGTLYVTNSGAENTTMTAVQIDGVDCSLDQVLEPGVNEVDISSCVSDVGEQDVTVVTDSGVLEASFYLDEPVVSTSSFLGVLLWNVTNSSFDNRFGAVAIDSNDNLYSVDYNSFGFGGMDIWWVSKYDSSGNFQWLSYLNNTVNDENYYGYDIVVDSNNDIISVGEYYHSAGSFEEIVLVLKHDVNGNIIMNVNFTDAAQQTYPGYVDVDGSNNIYVSYYSDSISGNAITKLNSSGSILWNLSNDFYDDKFAVDTVGNLYVFEDQSANFNISKFNPSGVYQWSTVVDFGAGDYATDIDVGPNGNIVALGSSASNIVVCTIDSNGNILFNNTLDYTQTVSPSALKVASDNSIFIGATISNTNNDYFVTNLDSSLNEVLNVTIDVDNQDYVFDIILDSNDNPILAGRMTDGVLSGAYLKFD